MRISVLIFIISFSTLFAQSQNIITVEKNSSKDYCISIDSDYHNTYGFLYPITYKFLITNISNEIIVRRKNYYNLSWENIPRKRPQYHFNGIETVRFDYDSSIAYVSVSFDEVSDSIFLNFYDENESNIEVTFQGMCKYYDNRNAVVTCSADDWSNPSNEFFSIACSYFRERGLWLSCGVITQWIWPSTWTDIQAQLDSGFIEVCSHSKTHPGGKPYDDAVYQIRDSKQDILDYLEMPDLFRKNDREYVYTWIAPHGYTDSAIDSLLGENEYIINRLYIEDEDRFSDWDSENSIFEPFGPSKEVGPVWLGTNNLDSLNKCFDETIERNGIYHLMCHPRRMEWDSTYTKAHIDYISRHKDIWYVSLGHLYLYRMAYCGVSTQVTNTVTNEHLPAKVELYPNYPNPFNPTTRIEYKIEKISNIRILIYDIQGQLIEILVDGQKQTGSYFIDWDASKFSNGLYFCRLQTDKGLNNTIKLILIK